MAKKPNRTLKKALTVRLPDDIQHKIDLMAYHKRKKKQVAVRIILEEYFELHPQKEVPKEELDDYLRGRPTQTQ